MKKIIYSAFALQAMLFSSLQAANQDDAMPSPEQGLMQTLMMVGIALLFFYFIMWRPEQKRRKEMETQRNALRKGDKVTAMGILGTVASVKEQTVILRMVDGAKIEVLKGAITDVVAGSDEDAKKAEKEES